MTGRAHTIVEPRRPSRRAQLCIMAKQPMAGLVKTRLAQRIGDSAAATLAHAFFCDTLALARGVAGVDLAISYAGDMESLPAEAAGVRVWEQGKGDLGERMERALRRGLALATSAIVIGTDTPALPAARIARAVTLLRAHDAVLGPADDGGFYLLGLRRCTPGLLAGLHWSASTTLADTRARLHERALRVALLEPWFDIDEYADLQRLSAALVAGEMHAPATAKALLALARPHAR
jgi:rSAM/selenodomain-associated transferase 1